MKGEEKILYLAKQNNGYVTTKMVEDSKISRRFLGFMVKEKKLEKIDYGIYTLPGESEDMYYILQNKSKNIVFSHMTALYFHNLCNRLPHIIDLTVTDTYRGSLQKRLDINMFRVKTEYINLGIINVKSPFGNEIKIYDIERSICDIIKNKKDIELELFNKAIRGYYSSKNKDFVKLMEYAKKFKLEKEVLATFEVLL